MNRTVVAIVAVAGIVVACAPISKTPENPALAGASPAELQQFSAIHSPVMNPGPSMQGTKMSFSGIKKADLTVAEIYAEKDGLAGTVVKVRAKVVKFNSQIMGRNWAHVQDGSGSSGTNDLTVTTTDFAKIGDTVLVSGKITLNKDFGSGYKYPLIVEDGSVIVEQ